MKNWGVCCVCCEVVGTYTSECVDIIHFEWVLAIVSGKRLITLLFSLQDYMSVVIRRPRKMTYLTRHLKIICKRHSFFSLSGSVCAWDIKALTQHRGVETRSKWEKKARMVCSIFWKKMRDTLYLSPLLALSTLSHVWLMCNSIH